MPSNYILLERIELNASAASVTFASIPQTGYTDLKVVASVRTDRALANDYLKLTINSGSSYSGIQLAGNGSSASSATFAGIFATQYAGEINGNTSTASVFSSVEVYFPNYLSSTAKSYSVESAMEQNATTTYLTLDAGLWSGTAAITTLAFAPGVGTNFVANSTFSLYGLAATGTTPVIAPKASGGNIIDYDGTYWIHTFLTSGTFTPSTGLSCDYLVVAGGGGGGGQFIGGGGGAGGYRSGLSFNLTSSLTVTVGAGGTSTNTDTAGTAGSNSVLSSITASGGGGGGRNNIPTNAGNGGSGGGGGEGTSFGTGNAGGYSPVEGYNGGMASDSAPNYGSGGGGGSSAVGVNGTSTVGGNGGAGTASSITGTSVTRAGGGGAGVYGGTSIGIGSSGGGNGGSTQGTPHDATSATVNTGSGGGGAGGNNSTAGYGGNGGSGIVIIRYLAA